MFEWREELNTGMSLIDEQHRQFGRFVNGFLKAYPQGQLDDRKLNQAFGFLQAYAREHLSTEEALMEEYEYPDRSRHLGRHEYLSSWIQDAGARLQSDSYSDSLAMEANGVLVDWFQTHITTVDMRLTQFLQRVAEERQDGKLLRLIKGVFKRPSS